MESLVDEDDEEATDRVAPPVTFVFFPEPGCSKDVVAGLFLNTGARSGCVSSSSSPTGQQQDFILKMKTNLE